MIGVFCLFFYLYKNYGFLLIIEVCDIVKRYGIYVVFDSVFCGCFYRLMGGLLVRIDIFVS